MSCSEAVHLMLEEVTSIVNKPPSVGEAVGAGVGVVVGAGVDEVDEVVSSTTTIVATAKQNAKATRRYLRDFAGGCDFAGEVGPPIQCQVGPPMAALFCSGPW